MKPYRIIPMILLVMVLLYSLSFGPVMRIQVFRGGYGPSPKIPVPAAYEPLFLACHQSQITAHALEWYLSIWLSASPWHKLLGNSSE